MNKIFGLLIFLTTSLSIHAQLSKGNTAPDFSLSDQEGRILRLSDFKGKVVLLDFWASWCPNCRRAHPGMVRLYDQFKERGLVFIGISIDKDKNKWINAIKKDRLSYLQVNDPEGWEAPTAANFGVEAIPATFLIDREGKIILVNGTKSSLSAAIDKLLSP